MAPVQGKTSKQHEVGIGCVNTVALRCSEKWGADLNYPVL